MPTPHGSRGGVAFSADELRVLSGALAIALQSEADPEEVREFLRLAEAVEETVREGHRQRTFQLADLARYREALPGAALGYLEQLEAALTTGYLPRPDDLAALRGLCEAAVGDRERARRTTLLSRCETLASRTVRTRPRLPSGRLPSATRAPAPDPPTADTADTADTAGTVHEPAPAPDEPDPEAPAPPAEAEHTQPPPDTHPEPAPAPAADADDRGPAQESGQEANGEPGRGTAREQGPDSGQEPGGASGRDVGGKSGRGPGPTAPAAQAGSAPPRPRRPVPTPAEVFPPRRSARSARRKGVRAVPGQAGEQRGQRPAGAGASGAAAGVRHPVPA